MKDYTFKYVPYVLDGIVVILMGQYYFYGEWILLRNVQRQMKNQVYQMKIV